MALITEILEGTLPAGQTGISFTNAAIPNSLIRIFSDDASLTYESATVSGTTLTIVYPEQTVNKSIAVELVKAPLSVIDNLTSDDTDNALSANQGLVLKGLIDNLPAPVTELSELDDVDITEITDGQILAYDELSEKFVNVNQSTGGGVNYSTTEQDTGLKWIDGKPVYQCVVTGLDVAIPNDWSATFATSLGIKYLIDAKLFDNSNLDSIIQLNIQQVQTFQGGIRTTSPTAINNRRIGQVIALYTKASDYS